ncbi:MAG: hypothetical protein IIB00_05640 [candidate division Zixibacteria bacterium]|nr:hypothetical protein [candidate division Zixibacteria bacterium]
MLPLKTQTGWASPIVGDNSICPFSTPARALETAIIENTARTVNKRLMFASYD